MLTAAHGDGHPSIAIALGHLAEVARRRHENERAVELLGRALTIRQAALGEAHPQLATTLQALAQVELEVGRTADARAHAQRALELLPADAEARAALEDLLDRAQMPSQGPSTPP
jgi:tetratricopeptide (TPR) repeat protein